MEIKLNGKSVQTHCQTLAELVLDQDLVSSSLVIEHNLKVVKEADWAQTPVREGDTIELLNFVGGG